MRVTSSVNFNFKILSFLLKSHLRVDMIHLEAPKLGFNFGIGSKIEVF